MSNIFKHIVYNQPPPPNSNAYPTFRNIQTIHQMAPKAKQQNKWEKASNVRRHIVGVTLLSCGGLGAITTIVLLKIGVDHIKNVYQKYNGYFLHMYMLKLCKYDHFYYWRLSMIHELQALLLPI